MNTALARQVMDHIEAIAATPGPDRWDQEENILREDCGTTACFAGWAVLLADGREMFPGEEPNPMAVEDRARALLGIDYAQASMIFFLFASDPAELRAAVEEVFGPLDASPAEPKVITDRL